MEEDEEVDIVPENSDFHVYSKQVGFKGLDTNLCSKFSNSPIEKCLQNKSTTESIDIVILEQVDILLSKNLLFQEDRLNVEQLFSTFELKKISVLRSIFRGITSFIVLVIGFSLYFVIGAFSFIFMGVYYAYKASDYMWKKHFLKKRLTELVTILEDNYKLLRRTYKFISENNNLLKAQWGTSAQSDVWRKDELNEKTIYLRNLEKEFLNMELLCIKLFKKYTKLLIKHFPIMKNIKDAEVCYALEESTEISVPKLHNMYLLAQSEFLQRLIYCLVPNIQTSKKQGNKKLLQCIICTISDEFFLLHRKLSNQFKYVFLNGIYIESQVKYFSPSRKVSHVDKRAQLLNAVHETSLLLQRSLITARTLECMIEENTEVSTIEDNLQNLQSDLNSSQSFADDSFILFKRLYQSVQIKEEKTPVHIEHNHGDDVTTEIGYSTLDPVVDDDIFEADCMSNKEETNVEEFYVDDVRNRKRLEKEYSTNVLKELKTKLVVKANEWKAREAKVLHKKGKITLEDLNQNEDLNLPTSEDVEWPLPSFRRCRMNRKNGRIVQNLNELELTPEDYYVKKANINLMSSSILEMSNKLFMHPPTEEVLCASGENSEDELCNS